MRIIRLLFTPIRWSIQKLHNISCERWTYNKHFRGDILAFGWNFVYILGYWGTWALLKIIP